MHLNDALALALSEGAKTITEDHLIATAQTEDRVTLAFETALQGEADLFQAKEASKRLINMIWSAKNVQTPLAEEETGNQEQSQNQQKQSHRKRRNLPGNRSPNRDAIGTEPEVDDPDGDVHIEKSVG